MLCTILTSSPAIDVQHLRAFSNMYDLELLSSYQNFLLTYNGGHPKPAVFPIIGFPDNPFGRIQVFFGLGTTVKTSDLNWCMDDLRGFVPMGILPIGCTGSGDYICLDPRQAGAPVLF